MNRNRLINMGYDASEVQGMMTRAEELGETYSRAMGGKPVDVFVYNESGALESKVIGYKCKAIEETRYVKKLESEDLKHGGVEI